jgi:hypothetical protein
MIEENRSLEEKNVEYSITSGQKYNQELLLSFERERRAILRKHRSEIAALQSRMVEVQRYCSSLEGGHGGSVYGHSKLVLHENTKGVYSEQLAYYK